MLEFLRVGIIREKKNEKGIIRLIMRSQIYMKSIRLLDPVGESVRTGKVTLLLSLMRLKFGVKRNEVIFKYYTM